MNFEQLEPSVRKLQLPLVAVDLDAFDRNIARLVQHVKDVGRPELTLRIATKSIRVPELIERTLKADPIFKGVMAFSAHEVLELSRRGILDFLLAYPTLQVGDQKALLEARDLGAQVRVVVDHRSQLEALAQSFNDPARPLEVVADLDLSLRYLGGLIHLGVRRSPLRTFADVWRLYESLQAFPGLRWGGVMGYEAQVAGLGDRNPFSRLLNTPKHWIRRLSVAEMRKRRQSIADGFEKRGVKIPLFNGGGTGSLNWACAEQALTEVTAGSALFTPHLFDYYSNIQFEPACAFALQAVRSSDPGFVTLQGGGYIASGEPGWDRVPVPVWPAGLKLVSTEGCGEVQTPVSGAGSIPLGSAVWFRHAKAGELMERFNEVHLVSKGKLSARASTYRGLGWSFF